VNSQTINLNDELRKLTLMAAVRIFLGSEKTKDIEQVRDWFTTLMVKTRSAIVKWDVPFISCGQGQIARCRIVEYVRWVIQERRERGALDDAQDVLGLLLHTVDEGGQKFTEIQVINQAIRFLFAAHETTANLMSWSLLELGQDTQRVKDLRFAYRLWSFTIAPRNLVFLDETGIHLAMTRLYGRALRGERLYDSEAPGKGGRTSR
jgi:cytochrome P450